jgi:hypothetical protein
MNRPEARNALSAEMFDGRCGFACRRWVFNFLNKKDLSNVTYYTALGLGADYIDQFIR